MRITTIPCAAFLQALPRPLYSVRVPCGFASPADDHLDKPLDLTSHVVTNPAATFFARAEGDSMKDLGITDGDLLVVNRSAIPKDGDVVIAAINGELLCKQLDLKNKQLRSANPKYRPIPVSDMETLIEGVVTHAMHYLR